MNASHSFEQGSGSHGVSHLTSAPMQSHTYAESSHLIKSMYEVHVRLLATQPNELLGRGGKRFTLPGFLKGTNDRPQTEAERIGT